MGLFRRMKRVGSKVLGVDESMGRLWWSSDGSEGDVSVLRTANGDTLLQGAIIGPLSVHFEDVELDAADTVIRFLSEAVKVDEKHRKSKESPVRSINGRSQVSAK